MTDVRPTNPREPSTPGASRRAFIGYVMAGATLATAADMTLGSEPADAAIPTPPQIPEVMDLNDLLTLAAQPTANLITVTIGEDGRASFALPRAEVGQGIVTSSAMMIAEELDLPVDKVDVTLAQARPELVFNQLTGGSNTTISTYTPIRVAAALAKQRLLEAAATVLGDTVDALVAKGGLITDSTGASIGYGELSAKAAVAETVRAEVNLKSRSQHTVIGTPQRRTDARAAVTGAKVFAMDLDVPDALPTMVARPPTHNGAPVRLRNQSAITAMPGVTDVAVVPTGVAVRAKTFGQCIDAVIEMDVEWEGGKLAGEDDASVLANLKNAELPMAVPKVPLLAKQVDAEFTFRFRSNSSLEPNCAIADVRSGSARIWGSMKSPVVAQEEIAAELGLPISSVNVEVTQGGGSFGRKLFHDAALEASRISKAMGKPVKLMWHRADEPRQGRLHPMCTSRVRATHLLGQVLSFEQRHTSVKTDFGHGLGEIITGQVAKLPVGDLTFSQTIFTLTQEIPYNFGVVTQLLNETDDRFNTGSMRNIYSPDVRVANELVVDELARSMRKDPVAFRRSFLRNDRARAALDRVAEVGEWGRDLPEGVTQGVAIHKEYKGVTACLVELDMRPETVNRDIRAAVTGPRVTKVVFAVDAGLVINPTGLDAQMLGGVMDGIALALTSSCHFDEGHFLEASWDNYFYTRQWNAPPELRVEIMPSQEGQPGGAGEAGVAASFAAIACAYARATGRMPTEFPINHADPVAFEPKPFVPSVPQSPTNGLNYTY
ncbi:molybdopterin cofactor-binding domain-containing protein [Janibacter cremeus]|uniref:Isoquinoline 1-oxidoreductase beta subunit n=1 Tax=Janibacter cremeus TaxID=1285192 RepID=A0A852VTW4_9MICO|nr:molybdopterin cofactor-binding domain-containing protein [Janibacter cremeus]NYF97724.1 isoquinoline 1-oxidoreductase beta subunit [Janibacter cremeus]